MVNLNDIEDQSKIIRHIVTVAARKAKDGPGVELVVSHDGIALGTLTFYDGMPNIDQNFAWYEVED